MHKVEPRALQRGLIDVNATVDVALVRRALEVYLAHAAMLDRATFSCPVRTLRSVRFQTVNSVDCHSCNAGLPRVGCLPTPKKESNGNANLPRVD